MSGLSRRTTGKGQTKRTQRVLGGLCEIFYKPPLHPHLSRGRVSGTKLPRGQYSHPLGVMGSGGRGPAQISTEDSALRFSVKLLAFPLLYSGFFSLLEGAFLWYSPHNHDTVEGYLDRNPGSLATLSCQSYFVALSLSLHICKTGATPASRCSGENRMRLCIKATNSM